MKRAMTSGVNRYSASTSYPVGQYSEKYLSKSPSSESRWSLLNAAASVLPRVLLPSASSTMFGSGTSSLTATYPQRWVVDCLPLLVVYW